MPPRILVVNPGSTTTRLALYEGGAVQADSTLECPVERLRRCGSVIDQVPMRTEQVEAFLRERGVRPADLDAVAARGGPLRPVPGGVYRVNAAMLADARDGRFVDHISRAACLIGHLVAAPVHAPVFVVDPVSTDEFDDISRISGLADLPRVCLTHALNQKRVARLYAEEVGRPYEALNLIVAHLGGGITLAVHSKGRMIDAVDSNGEGPFSPQRSGGLRVDGLARLVAGRNGDATDFVRGLTRRGGLVSHLGTEDAREVERRIDSGAAQAERVYRALAYQVAKSAAGLAAVVSGRVDAVLLTGGLARSDRLTGWIAERIGFLGEVRRYEGEHEMEALHAGAHRALSGRERVRSYPTGEFES